MDNIADRAEFYDQNLQPVLCYARTADYGKSGFAPPLPAGTAFGQKLLEI